MTSRRKTNRRRTLERQFSLRRLLGLRGNRRVRPKTGEVTATARATAAESSKSVKAAKSAASRTPLQLKPLLSAVGRGALVVGKVVLVLALLTGIGGAGYYSYRRVVASTYFNIREVEVEATRRTSAAEIRRMVRGAMGQNILSVDMDRLRLAVLAHPWIREAELSRELPDTLRVRVEEHRPRAALLMGHLYLVNEAGQVFKRASAEEAVGMPVITGISRLSFLNQPRQAEQRIKTTLTALDRYYGKVRPPLSEVHVGKLGEITLYLRRGGLAVRLGQQGASDERLARLDAVTAALGPELRRARVIFLDGVTRGDRVTVRMGNYQ